MEEEQYEIKNRKYKRIFNTILLICITVVITSTATFYYATKRISAAGLKISKVDESVDGEDPVITAISKSLESFKRVVDANYRGEIDEENLINETIKGYIKGLGDKYSEYFTAEEWAKFEETALGNYYGIGVYMAQDDNDNIVISSVIKESPAEEVGLKAEDVIVKINDEDFLGKTPTEASTLIKGYEGESVKITVYRNSQYLDFDIVRREVRLYHVETEMLDNNIGYISLLTFDDGSAEELRNAVIDLKNKGAQKFVLDLRYNTGGLVYEAIDIASVFLPNGTNILYTVDCNDAETVSKTENDPVDTESKLVILVNDYSASASEILTGALKDLGRATVVGETTYGKGVIQNAYSLVDGSVLKLTIAEYFTPNKNKINGVGIEPDYKVEITDKDLENDNDSQLEKAKELLK